MSESSDGKRDQARPSGWLLSDESKDRNAKLRCMHCSHELFSAEAQICHGCGSKEPLESRDHSSQALLVHTETASPTLVAENSEGENSSMQAPDPSDEDDEGEYEDAKETLRNESGDKVVVENSAVSGGEILSTQAHRTYPSDEDDEMEYEDAREFQENDDEGSMRSAGVGDAYGATSKPSEPAAVTRTTSAPLPPGPLRNALNQGQPRGPPSATATEGLPITDAGTLTPAIAAALGFDRGDQAGASGFSYRNACSNTRLLGLNPPAGQGVTVCFHALISIEHWGWDEESSVFIRFGHKDLGFWKENCGSFHTCRSVADGYIGATCTMTIDPNILAKPDQQIPYKYVVFSPNVDNDRKSFECLHAHTKQHSTRSLVLHPTKGAYHQYDTIVYPRKLPFLWSKLSRDTPTKMHVAAICLTVYLEDMQKWFRTPTTRWSIPKVVEEIVYIVNCISKWQYCKVSSAGRKFKTKEIDIRKDFTAWLLKELKTCSHNQRDDTMSLVAPMCAAMCLCQPQFLPAELSLDDVVLPVVRMLKFGDPRGKDIRQYHHEARHLYEKLCLFLPEENRPTAASNLKILLGIVRDGITKEFLHLPEWFLALPLYHLLSGTSVLFERPEMNPSSVKWGDEELGLVQVTSKINAVVGGRFVDQFYTPFSRTFAVDQLLLPIFIRLCPVDEYPLLFKKIPVFMSITWLAFKAKETFAIDKAEQWKSWMLECNQVIANTSTQQQSQNKGSSITVNAALLLCRRLMTQLKTAARYSVIVDSISLFLFAVGQMLSLCNFEQCKDDKTNALSQLQQSFSEWVSTVVGYDALQANPDQVDPDWGIKFWSSFLELKCPQELLEEWLEITKTAYADCVPAWQKIELLRQLSHSQTTLVVFDGLMEGGLKAVSEVLPPGGKEMMDCIAGLGQHLCGMLLRKYPNLMDTKFSLTLDQLLDWDVWPSFIIIYGSEGMLQHLPLECQIACTSAHSSLQSICDQVMRGDITMNDIEKIEGNLSKVKELCKVAQVQVKSFITEREENASTLPTTPGDNEGPPHESSDTVRSQVLQHDEIVPPNVCLHLQRPTKSTLFDDIRKAVCLRKEEFVTFEQNKPLVIHLCKQLLKADVKGLPEAMEELANKDYRDVPIRSLCCRGPEGRVQLCDFKPACSLVRCSHQFDLMSKKYSNEIFAKVWELQLRTIGPNLTTNDIFWKVWQPTITECTVLLEQLVALSLPCTKIQQYFPEQDLEEQLTAFVNGVKAFVDGPEIEEPWVKMCSKKIQAYRDLCRYRDLVDAFHELKEAMALTGDFEPLKYLHQKLSTFDEIQTLKDVEEDVSKAGGCLDGIHLNQLRRRCLHEFSQCQKIVTWIKGVGDDVSVLQGFVDVALNTAVGGEDDYKHDRLSRLKVVGSEYGPLIFKLPKDTGFGVLLDRCQAVWKALEKNVKLPNMLAQCLKHLDWYESVKSTQGSVEVSSFEQLNIILEYGQFRVGSSTTQTSQNIHDIVHLRLISGTKQHSKMNFSLNELRDLESRLVLIAGHKGDHTEEVDRYLEALHSACQVAEILLQLREAGNVSYTKWVIEFFCVPDVVREVQKMASDMETNKSKWKLKVKAARDEFCELNYYTTRQILYLREKLGKLRDRSVSDEIHPSVIALLQSTSGVSNSQAIAPVVQDTLTELDRTQAAQEVDDSFFTKSVVDGKARDVGKEILRACDPHVFSAIPDNWSEQQREVFAKVTHTFHFSKKLAGKAVEKLGKCVKPTEAIKWCTDNESDYECSESDASGEEEMEEDVSHDVVSDHSDSESDYSTEEVVPKHDMTSTVSTHASEVTVREAVVIDELHPVVVQLRSKRFEYTLDEAITAVEHCGPNCTTEEAVRYLNSQESDSNDVFRSPVNYGNSKQTMKSSADADSMIITLVRDNEAERKHLSITELGSVLKNLSQKLPVNYLAKRAFPHSLKTGSPNLLVVPQEEVLKTTVSLYMEDSTELNTDDGHKASSLPTLEEVLICNQSTTAEEVKLLWRRAVKEFYHKRTFCLVHPEKLSYMVADKSLRSLKKVTQGVTEPYQLVIICSSEDESQSHVISKLRNYRRHYSLVCSDADCKKYLMKYFTGKASSSDVLMASLVDQDQSSVRVVCSTWSGMGKSFFVHKMARSLELVKQGVTVHQSVPDEHNHDKTYVNVPIHGPLVSSDVLMELFGKHFSGTESAIFHLDVAPSVLDQVDTLLFSLLVLRGLSDSHGRVWRCLPSQLYAVEVTLPVAHRHSIAGCTLALLDLLPTVQCVSPCEALKIMSDDELEDPSKILMDEEEFESSSYQRVYQYLHRFMRRVNLDGYTYSPGSLSPDDCVDCLRIILRHCGVRNPTWSEVHHFVAFLDIQLQSCEQSVFCNRDLAGDSVPGLKNFVVDFMTEMSKDFATPSLLGEVQRPQSTPVPHKLAEQLEQGLEMYEVMEDKEWEPSSHPYIFFNRDRISITFVGFMVTMSDTRENYFDLVDPKNHVIIKRNVMSALLLMGLQRNGVIFNEECLKWPRHVMIHKLAAVMGIDIANTKRSPKPVDTNSYPGPATSESDSDSEEELSEDEQLSDSVQLDSDCEVATVLNTSLLSAEDQLTAYRLDPDSSYVLTVDNLIKILAIQMRFRCNIPVVILGETGCGKTRLIKYMCDLARKGEEKNLLVLKVHGGTSQANIIEFFEMAQATAQRNTELNQDTVVFFDEANTTDAIGLLKEIMCDRRLQGEPISEDIKVIAACNPYRMHSEEMIKKLESAGLGFHMEAREKLGKVPLRNLVYRVHDIPASMRPFVYDFGQLNHETQEVYIKQIVANHVRGHPGLSQLLTQDSNLVNALAEVLVWSQVYMRKREDECSFVSLRDVTRAMMVFKYFYDKRDLFAPKHGAVELSTPINYNRSLLASAGMDMAQDESADVSAGVHVDQGELTLEEGAMMALETLHPDQPSPGCNLMVNSVQDCQVELTPGDGEGSCYSSDRDYSSNESGSEPLDEDAARVPDRSQCPTEKDGVEELPQSLNDLTRSFVLAISVCYQARLQDREGFEEGVVQTFEHPLSIPGGVIQFRNEIQCCQDIILENMELGPNIARNAALRENVFMMTVCIELKIPLFLVGKPGSSKSLAKSIVASSMQGTSSTKDLMKNFKQVQIFSYQCSQLSTPESVIEVFNTAKRFQKRQNNTKYVSVVVLDEVGLAEDSPGMPLKALHPLLEDGTEELATSQEGGRTRVAFIGISNWALDPAKMNRGVMVTRGVPNINELVLSARGICSRESNPEEPDYTEVQARPVAGGPVELGVQEDHSVIQKLEKYFDPLAEAYSVICRNQEQEFFGLRDFYSLVKMLYWLCSKSRHPPTEVQLEHAIKRNFGGHVGFAHLEPFSTCLGLPQLTKPPKDRSDISEDCTTLGMIKASLRTKEATWHGENRYLLFLTENYAALEILRHCIMKDVRTSKPEHQIDRVSTRPEEMEPFILFGSSFPKDKDYTQVCKNINQIKICMETGRTVILLNLENLYESLYDVLNQYYIYLGEQRYVDLGLQTHRVKCRVDRNFKLILIAEKDVVYQKFPIPLINRLEKHFVVTSSVLTDWQLGVMHQLKQWVQNFSRVLREQTRISNVCCEGEFKEHDAFLGYQSDTAAAVVFRAVNQLQLYLDSKQVPKDPELLRALSSELLRDVSLSDLQKESSPEWGKAVLQLSKYLLLHNASPDALIRLTCTSVAPEVECLVETYTDVQQHECLRDFLHLHLSQGCSRLLLQVTTRSHLHSLEQLIEDLNLNNITCTNFVLQQFDTEMDFSSKIGSVFKREKESAHDHLLIIHCDAVHTDSDLISCAQNRVFDQIINNDATRTHVLFIVYVPRQAVSTAFISFQGEPWVCTHIDDLRAPTDVHLSLCDVRNKFYSDMFMPASDDVYDKSQEDVHVKFVATGEQVHVPERMLQSRIRRPGQYHLRLHQCIQAAASKLQDCTKRKYKTQQCIAILDKLMTGGVCEGVSPFRGSLTQYIYQLLKEREDVYDDKHNWILTAVLKQMTLITEGTFRKVVTHTLDELVIPIFTAVIASIHQYCNLDLLWNSETKSLLQHDCSVFQLWMALFKDPRVMKFSYDEQSPRITGDFKCRFPFFWLITEAFDSMLKSAKGVVGNDDPLELHKHLCTLASENPLSTSLSTVAQKDCEKLYDAYLHDFVRRVHECTHKESYYKDMEHKLITRALSGIVPYCQDDCFANGNFLLAARIAAVHIAYHSSRKHISGFQQLVSVSPGILEHLKHIPDDDLFKKSKMILHLVAVRRELTTLEPPLDDVENVHVWLTNVRMSQNAINAALALPSCEEKFHKQTRLEWQRVQAMQMFVEHIVIKYDDMLPFANRLNYILNGNSDFQLASTVEGVKKLLTRIRFKPKKKREKDDFKISCHRFFAEMVSTLCFGGQDPPEKDLTNLLLDTVFAERPAGPEVVVLSPTRELDGKPDEVPVIRSFLLQLLLQHNLEIMRESLQAFFTKSCEAYMQQEPHSISDWSLCLLYIQCFEDNLFKQGSGSSFTESVSSARNILMESKPVLTPADITLPYLEDVASVRYALSVVADVLYRESSKECPVYSLHDYPETDSGELLKCTQELCISHSTSTAGPIIFLVKLLVRRYGTHVFWNVVESNLLSWVKPKELATMEDEHSWDPFVIHSKPYNDLREKLKTYLLYENELPNLEAIFLELQQKDSPLLVLALYVTATLNSESSKQVSGQVLQSVDQFTTSCDSLNLEMKRMARALLANQQGGNLLQLKITHGQPTLQRTVGCVVVHAAAVFICAQHKDMLQPLVRLMKDPASLVEQYLPAMPDDPFKEVESHTRYGNFYACKNGHPYYVGECGLPVEPTTCPHCHENIGADLERGHHFVASGNKEVVMRDETKTGHCLGSPESRHLIPERDLSPASCCILQALMHSALIWACCNDEDTIPGLVDLVQGNVRPNFLPEFFWNHLIRDLELLCQALNKSFDECALILHLILKRILTRDPPKGDTPDLMYQEGRKTWENLFHRKYIRPVLEKLDTVLDENMKLVQEDKKGYHQLYTLVYEKVKVDERNLEPHLWTYRCRITLEHLSQTLLQEDKKEERQVLREFLQREHQLRATQYLPDIVKLQQLLCDRFNRRLDREEAKAITIGMFLATYIKSKSTRSLYQKLIERTKMAWKLTREQLKEHARLKIEREFLLEAITDETPLEYLIPTTTGAGACSMALADFLLLVHNNFVERCRGIVAENDKVMHKGPRVPLTQLHQCHLLDYEDHLPSVILSHCHYSLTVGSGQKVTYDFVALEKHILNRFVYGKPLILADIPQVVYRKELYDAETFAAVRAKVQLQIPLEPHVKQEILNDLCSMDRVKPNLDVIDVALGILSTAGGKAERSLSTYVLRVLKMNVKDKLLPSIVRNCKLGHVLALWEALSVQIARQSVIAKQEPFNLKPEFLQQLSEDQAQKLDECLRSFEIEQLLGVLCEFIQTYMETLSPSFGLVETLDAYLERFTIPRQIKRFKEDFPQSITLAQTSAAWKHIIVYQQQQVSGGTLPTTDLD